CLAFSPDGSILAAGGGHGLVRFINLPKGDVRGDYPIGRPTTCLAFSKDGKTIARSDPAEVVVLNTHMTHSIEPIQTLAVPPGTNVEALAYSPDGGVIAAGGTNGTLYVWDAATGQLIATSGEVLGAGRMQLSFLSDDKLVIAFHDGSRADGPPSVKLW